MANALTPSDLQQLKAQFSGGSERRFRHWANRRFIYSEGMKAVADAAGAYWMLDIIATEVAPMLCRKWDSEGWNSWGFSIHVTPERASMLEVKLGEERIWHRAIEYTDFAAGQWEFMLAMDGLIEAPKVVLVMFLVEEN
jgi:hypothetical protein